MIIFEFETNTFKPHQQVVMYVEIDNFAAEQTTDGFETELRGSYQILNSEGIRVVDHELPVDKQVCQHRRRDYFIAYRFYLPKRLPAGEYRIELEMQDVKGQKFGLASLDFEMSE